MSLNTLLMSDDMIKERTSIHGNIDPKLIYADIKVSQDMFILPILGTALYDRLQELVNSNDWAGADDYKDLLDKYILDALMYYTLAELPQTLGYQFWNKGIVRKLGSDTELPTMSELMDISNKYRDRAEWYADRLRKYLLQNATDKFKEYYSPGNSIDTVYPEQKSFSNPIYLGDMRNPFNNPGGFTDKPYGQ
jgi:hypothetical protein